MTQVFNNLYTWQAYRLILVPHQLLCPRPSSSGPDAQAYSSYAGF